MNTRGLAIVCIGNLLVWFFLYRVLKRKQSQRFSAETLRALFIVLGTVGLISSVVHLGILGHIMRSFKGAVAFGIVVHSLLLLTDLAYLYVGAKLEEILAHRPALAIGVVFANGGALIIYTIHLAFEWIGGSSVFQPIGMYLFVLVIRFVFLLLMGARSWQLADELNPPSELEKICDYSAYE